MRIRVWMEIYILFVSGDARDLPKGTLVAKKRPTHDKGVSIVGKGHGLRIRVITIGKAALLSTAPRYEFPLQGTRY